MSAQGRQVSGSEDRPALVATFANAWEADLFQQFLADAGIPAWVDKAGLDSPYRLTAGGMGVVRLFAPLGRVDEARTLLADLEPEPVGEVEESSAASSPAWVIVAGAVLLAAIVISAIPHELRLPVVILTLGGFLFWWWLPLRSQRRPPDDRPNDANGAP